MKRSTWISILKYAVAGLILLYLALSDALNLGLLVEAFSTRGDLIALAAGIFFVVLNIGVVRWMLLLRAQDIHLGYGDAARLTFIGHFWNLAVPGAVGGDVVKAYYVASSFPDRKHESFTAVALDRIVGLYALFFLASIAVLFAFEDIQAIPSLAVLGYFVLATLTGATIGSTLFLSRWVRETLKLPALLGKLPLGGHIARIADAVYVYRSHLPTLFATLAASVVCHASLVVMIILCTLAIDAEADLAFSKYFVVGPLGLFANAVPLTPGGLGVGETSFQKLMALASEEAIQAGGNIFLIWRSCAYVWMLPGLYFYLRGRGKIRQMLAEGEELEST